MPNPKSLSHPVSLERAMLVLDTGHLSVLEWEASSTTQRLLERLSHVAPDEAAITIINFEEQMRGWLAYLSRARTLTQ